VPRCIVDAQMLAAAGDADSVKRHVIDEPRKRRSETDDQRNHATPVRGISRGIAIHAVEVVHVRHRHIAAASEVVAVPRSQIPAPSSHVQW
jgi:hypothetical protein